MHRRGFLIGLGALLTAPYVAKLQSALAQNYSPIALISEEEASRTLIAEPSRTGFKLYFDVSREPEPQYTYREMLLELWGEKVSRSGPITPEDKARLSAVYDLDVTDLDAIAPFKLYADQWRERQVPGYEVYSYLDDLDLGPTDEEEDELLGALDFIEGECPGSSYYAVEAKDELTLHLLQARLLDLGEDVFIRIIKEQHYG